MTRRRTEVPEIDGLAHDVLRRAMRDGNAATISRWDRHGHRLMTWECDWSSQTSGCQAGLLHGNNHDIPAFRWWDKEWGTPWSPTNILMGRPVGYTTFLGYDEVAHHWGLERMSVPRYVVWRRHPYNPIGERLGRDSRVASQQECLLG